MKYLKLYEDIKVDFDDWDEEEDDHIIPFSIGDMVNFKGVVNFWSPRGDQQPYDNGDWKSTDLGNYNYLEVVDIKKSDEITKDDYHKIQRGSIDHYGYLFKIRNHWPWFKYKDGIVNQVLNENIDNVDFDDWDDEEEEYLDKIILGKPVRYYSKYMGKRVRIIPGTRYTRHQWHSDISSNPNVLGTIIETNSSSYNLDMVVNNETHIFRVMWDNGKKNSYTPYDLELKSVLNENIDNVDFDDWDEEEEEDIKSKKYRIIRIRPYSTSVVPELDSLIESKWYEYIYLLDLSKDKVILYKDYEYHVMPEDLVFITYRQLNLFKENRYPVYIYKDGSFGPTYFKDLPKEIREGL